jgi:DNA ligase (NAD+)
MTELKGEVKHLNIIGSLNKFKYGEGELLKWLRKNHISKIFISEKIDGCSFVAEYDNGNLINGSTRGDGYDGQDITEKLRLILPQNIKNKKYMYIRGEITLTGDDHLILGMKNKRNGTAGLLNDKETNPDKLKYLKAYVYQIMNSDKGIKDQFDYIFHSEFDYPFHGEVNVHDDIEEKLKKELYAFKENSIYGVDGIVLCSPDCKNEPNEYYPKNKVAFKVNQDAVATDYIGIEWNISKGGLLKPVVLIKPIEIDGTTVQRATGYNAKYIKDNNIGKGSKVSIVKSGDIIPKIIDIIAEGKTELPNECPCCGTMLTWKGVDLACTNIHCENATVKQVAHLLENCDVEGAGEKSLTNWGILTFEDLIAFKPEPKSKSQNAFAKQLEEKVFSLPENILFPKFSFEGAGETNVTKILEHYYTEKNVGQVTKIILGDVKGNFPEGIGQKTLDKIQDTWIDNTLYLLQFTQDSRFKGHLAVKTAPIVAKGSIGGKSFLITGTLSAPRKQIEKKIEAAGGKLASSVSKNLDFLVVGEAAGSKHDKALKLGVKCLTEEELNDLLK